MTYIVSLWLALLVGTSPQPPPPTHLKSIPHLAGKADVRLWNRILKSSSRGFLGHQPVFMRAKDGSSLAWLKSLGVAAHADEWVFTSLDYGTLTSAMGAGAGLELRSAPVHRPYSSSMALTEIDADIVQAGRGLGHAYTGKGVLVGIIDTGLDLHHPAFHRVDGSSRVVAVWDQDGLRGPTPVAFGYGTECDALTIARGACDIEDFLGHGTHVAGIAAGNSPSNGVASEADIAVVRSDDFTRLADGMAYLTQLATRRNQPLVVNISVGGQYGPHDGRTPLESYLNSMTGPGRIVVAAAGNDGDESIHIGTALSAAPVRVELHGLPLQEPTGTVVELWSTSEAQVESALELWLDDTLAASVNLATAGSDIGSGTLSYEGDEIASVVYGSDYAAEHGLQRHVLVIDRSQARYLPVGGVLVVRLSGTGDVQGWISQTDYNAGHSRFGDSRGPGWLAGDGSRSIAVPATAREIIAVGSYTVQVQWQSESDGTQELPDVALGSLSAFSSIGPTGYAAYTGYKPDLCAPGSVIVSARAAGVPAGPETLDGNLMVMQGTSMAAPHVTGVVALMLQANPSLTPRDVRTTLRATARTDKFTGVAPNFRWGYGKVDAYSAVRATEIQANGCAEVGPSLPTLLVALLVTFLIVRPRRQRRTGTI